jgi:hypothetical protein
VVKRYLIEIMIFCYVLNNLKTLLQILENHFDFPTVPNFGWTGEPIRTLFSKDFTRQYLRRVFRYAAVGLFQYQHQSLALIL